MIEIGDWVICIVERIEGTTVFVKISHEGKELEGSIVTSEIAPGRIRNLRDYVVPKKKLVCKVLRISPSGNIELSLRRVTQKERKEVLEQEKSEKTYLSILKNVMKEKFEDTVKLISEKESIFEFFLEAKENPKKLEELLGKSDAKNILEILNSQKQRKISVKKEIFLSSADPNGLSLLKDILGKIKDIEVKSISAGRYSLKIESSDPKAADNKIKETILHIEKSAKQKEMNFSVRS